MFNSKSKKIRSLERENKLLRKQLDGLSQGKTRVVKFYKCCEDCLNNPKNNPNATGICNCTAPYFEDQQRNQMVFRTTATMEL